MLPANSEIKSTKEWHLESQLCHSASILGKSPHLFPISILFPTPCTFRASEVTGTTSMFINDGVMGGVGDDQVSAYG
jgi:hypothetical protein